MSLLARTALGVILTLCLPRPAAAAVYFVDSLSGDDARPGTSPDAAWKTLARANAAAYQPGDSLLLRRGRVWRETLAPPADGTPAAPLTCGAFGSGEKPVVSGADLVREFRPVSPRVWQAPLATGPAQVFFDDVRGTRRPTLAALAAERDWHWENGLLSIFSPRDPAAAYRRPGVEAAVRDHALLFDARRHVAARDLRLEKTRQATARFAGPSVRCALQGCEVYQGPTEPGMPSCAVLIEQESDGCEVTGCAIGRRGSPAEEGAAQGWSAYGGIVVMGANTRIRDNTLCHGAIENESKMGAYAYGIRVARTRGLCEIAGNTLYHTGSHGVFVDAATRAGDEISIHHNRISYCGGAGFSAYKTRASDGTGGTGRVWRNDISFCNRLAGLPGSSGNSACGIHFNDGREANVERDHPFIRWHCVENEVYDCQAPASPRNQDSGGIAVDFNADGVQVLRNLIYRNWGKGIYVYNADRALVCGNVVWGNDSGITVSAVSDGSETADDNEVCNNTFYRNYNGPAIGPNYDCEILFGLRSQRARIRNNILCSDNNGYAYRLFPGSQGLVVDGNCLYKEKGAVSFVNGQGSGPRTMAEWQALGFDVNGLAAQPRLADPRRSDFRLLPGSPCIDRGLRLPDACRLALDPRTPSFPYALVDQELEGDGWEIGAFGFVARR